MHTLDLPENLIEQEKNAFTESKKEDIDKNTNLAKSRIKTGLILNEIEEKNNLKISETEIKSEIEKQVKGMPGQEKLVMDYYQKNPSAIASLRGALYEEKILDLVKNKISLEKKTINLKKAEEILKSFNDNLKNETSNIPEKKLKKSKPKRKK